MFEAYFDESERTGGVFCVAGYAFVPQQARKFCKEWRVLFGSKTAHMTDLVARRGDFKDVSPAETNLLLKEAVRVINRRISFASAVSCHLDDVSAEAPKWVRGFGHAYPVCCHLAISALAQHIGKSGIAGDIAYFFESGHAHEAEAADFIRISAERPDMKAYYRHKSHTFVGKQDAPPLQAADLLAWEWAKCEDETVEQRLRPVRQSLRALVEQRTDRYRFVHLKSRESIRPFMDWARQAGINRVMRDQPDAIDEIRKRDPRVDVLLKKPFSFPS